MRNNKGKNHEIGTKEGFMPREKQIGRIMDEDMDTTENQTKGEDIKGILQTRKAQQKQGDKKGNREASRSPRLHKEDLET